MFISSEHDTSFIRMYLNRRSNTINFPKSSKYTPRVQADSCLANVTAAIYKNTLAILDRLMKASGCIYTCNLSKLPVTYMHYAICHK